MAAGPYSAALLIAPGGCSRRGTELSSSWRGKEGTSQQDQQQERVGVCCVMAGGGNGRTAMTTVADRRGH